MKDREDQIKETIQLAVETSFKVVEAYVKARTYAEFCLAALNTFSSTSPCKETKLLTQNAESLNKKK